MHSAEQTKTLKVLYTVCGTNDKAVNTAKKNVNSANSVDGQQQCLAEMRRQGAWTLGQDEKSSIVYGMPKVAFEMGGVQKQVPLEQMAISMLSPKNTDKTKKQAKRLPSFAKSIPFDFKTGKAVRNFRHAGIM